MRVFDLRNLSAHMQQLYLPTNITLSKIKADAKTSRLTLTSSQKWRISLAIGHFREEMCHILQRKNGRSSWQTLWTWQFAGGTTKARRTPHARALHGGCDTYQILDWSDYVKRYLKRWQRRALRYQRRNCMGFPHRERRGPRNKGRWGPSESLALGGGGSGNGSAEPRTETKKNHRARLVISIKDWRRRASTRRATPSLNCDQIYLARRMLSSLSNTGGAR